LIRFETAIPARQQDEWSDRHDPKTFTLKPHVPTPVAVSRKLALRMNANRRDYLADKWRSKENWAGVFRSSQ
jgi:hypothetical protein